MSAVYKCLNVELDMKNYYSGSQIAPLTHFSPLSHFYTPWKRQKTEGFSDVFTGYRNECDTGLKTGLKRVNRLKLLKNVLFEDISKAVHKTNWSVIFYF